MKRILFLGILCMTFFMWAKEITLFPILKNDDGTIDVVVKKIPNPPDKDFLTVFASQNSAKDINKVLTTLALIPTESVEEMLKNSVDDVLVILVKKSGTSKVPLKVVSLADILHYNVPTMDGFTKGLIINNKNLFLNFGKSKGSSSGSFSTTRGTDQIILFPIAKDDNDNWGFWLYQDSTTWYPNCKGITLDFNNTLEQRKRTDIIIQKLEEIGFVMPDNGTITPCFLKHNLKSNKNNVSVLLVNRYMYDNHLREFSLWPKYYIWISFSNFVNDINRNVIYPATINLIENNKKLFIEGGVPAEVFKKRVTGVVPRNPKNPPPANIQVIKKLTSPSLPKGTKATGDEMHKSFQFFKQSLKNLTDTLKK